MQIENNALEVLKEVSKKRNWYQGKISRSLAAETKRNLLKGKLSHEKASQLLTLAGWKKVKEEVWEEHY
jgi:hypothetical protein